MYMHGVIIHVCKKNFSHKQKQSIKKKRVLCRTKMHPPGLHCLKALTDKAM